MNAVELVFVITLLMEDSLSQSQKLRQSLIGMRALPPDVSDDPAQKYLQLPGLLSVPLELTGVGITTMFDKRLLACAFIALAQFDLPVLGPPSPTLAGLVIKPRVRGKSDGLLLHGRIDIDMSDM